MSTEVLLLAVLGCLTLVSYMTAINSHGPTRLSISYLLATIVLATTVWAIVQHVNIGNDRQKLLEMKKLEMEKKEAEERIKLQEAALRENRERAGFSSKVNNVINKGTGLASQIINVDLRDMSQDFDALLGYANATYQKTQDLGKNFSKLKSNDSFFKESLALVGEALKELEQAANYYRLFYRSEDTAQEELRERIMRQKARSSYEKLKEASSLLASES